MRTPNETRGPARRCLVLIAAALALLASCGSDGDPQSDQAAAEDSRDEIDVVDDQPVGAAGAVGESFVEHVGSVSAGLWSGESGIERIDLLVGTDDVERLERELREEAELIDGLEESWPVEVPSEYSDAYENYRSAVTDWRSSVGDALAVIETRGGELQIELNNMGEDIGQRMEASELSRIRDEVFDLRESALDSCFALQAAAQDEPPVITCTDVTPTAEADGDRIKVDAVPPFTLTLADASLPATPFPNGLDIGNDDTFYLTSKVQLADPNQPYSEMSINPIDPPADLREWIDATPIVRVVEEGEITIDGIDSRWWRITGNRDELEAAMNGVDFAAVWRHSGQGGPQQLNDFERTAITVWEIPHPAGTIYAFTKFAADNENVRDQVFQTMTSIRFDV